MTRRRFFASPNAFNRDNVYLPIDEARYLREVLRLRVGDEVYVFNGVGKEFQCVIEESRRESAQLRVTNEVVPARPESPLDLTLAVALLKGEKFDLVVQKATELGVTHIVPVATKLADVRLRDSSDAAKRVTRWQRIALEAAKQSGRAVVPEVADPLLVEDFIRAGDEDEKVRLLFSERDGEPLAHVTGKLPMSGTPMIALIGSEGGWTSEELGAARDAGWRLVTLGGRVMRAETAAIVVTALLEHLYGDLK